jgi:hypothetical protein
MTLPRHSVFSPILSAVFGLQTRKFGPISSLFATEPDQRNGRSDAASAKSPGFLLKPTWESGSSN